IGLTAPSTYGSSKMWIAPLTRLRILHTSETQSGKIFMPQVKNLLFIFVAALVLFFRSSSGLSAAYGIDVTGEMFITSILLFIVMRQIWSWKLAT
ncbi:KUP/HAK/KT family potassium transporter, partial [Rhizobium ruizarguesonis]